MAWRSERWADIVARAASTDPRERPAAPTDEDRASLAARAERWAFALPAPPVEVLREGIRIGAGIDSIDLALSQIYHLEPVDPWPSLAVGWVNRGQPYRTVVGPPPDGALDADRYAAAIDALFAAHRSRIGAALSPGWLAIPEQRWESVEVIPGEDGDAPAPSGGYRMAPGELDPVIARRTTARGAASLWTWMWSRLAGMPRRIDPDALVLTRRFVYARTRARARLRIDASTLRTGRRTAAGDTILVFGRSTELLLVHQDGCALARALESRVHIEEPR